MLLITDGPHHLEEMYSASSVHDHCIHTTDVALNSTWCTETKVP